MVFILAETTVFPFKFRAILGSRGKGRIDLAKTIREIQAYLGIKLLVSLATGVVAGLFCWAVKLDVPLLLGVIAFVLNFVPTIGSIIAAVPAMGLAFILHDVDGVVLVAIGYFAINTVFGNIIEPQLMGRRLGLSTLVIVLSLLFWFWVWGPIGALLSVPLTMVLKIMLENTPDLRWAAVLLDKVPPQARQSATAAAGVGASSESPPRSREPEATSEPVPEGTVGSTDRDGRDGVARAAPNESVSGEKAGQTTG
jgi:predicted PurR-regulated permease PerM